AFFMNRYSVRGSTLIIMTCEVDLPVVTFVYGYHFPSLNLASTRFLLAVPSALGTSTEYCSMPSSTLMVMSSLSVDSPLATRERSRLIFHEPLKRSSDGAFGTAAAADVRVAPPSCALTLDRE